MSSVLIKGLDLPHNGGYIEIRLHDDKAEVEVQELTFKDFEVVEIPTPHGRLIDGDKMEDTLSGLGDRAYRRAKGTIMDAQKFLSCAPTIIEAEEQEYEHID